MENRMSFAQKLMLVFRKLTLNSSILDMPVVVEKEYIDGLPEPIDDVERSYFQYKCQQRIMPVVVRVITEFAAIPLLVIYWLRKGERYNVNHKHDALFLHDWSDDIIPESVKQTYNIYQVRDYQDYFFLDAKDRHFLRKALKKYRFSFYFKLKCVIKVGMYSAFLTNTNVKAIICCDEFSYTSSLLTRYCELCGVEHINAMHGDKMYCIRDSFFRFTRCYVWNEYYVRMFCKLRADTHQFIVEVPIGLKIFNNRATDLLYDYTYYLAAEEDRVILTILRIMNELAIRGNKVAIRPHPRYPLDNRKFNLENYKVIIEDPMEVDINDSLSKTRGVISLYSTVLSQAYLNNIPIVIDDMSNRAYYERILEREYIGVFRKHMKLSELLNLE